MFAGTSMFRAHWNLESVGPEPPPCALAIGNFDGLHLGHRRILTKTKEHARRIGGEAVVLTFDPHPTTVVAPERAPDLLMLPAERLRRFEECGIDAGVVLPFTERIARLAPEEFVEQILVKKLNVRAVVVGEGFRFGHRQSGNTKTLIDAGSRHGFEVVTVQAVSVGGQPVSSSRVRTLVRQGAANARQTVLLARKNCFRARYRIAPDRAHAQSLSGDETAAGSRGLCHLHIGSRERPALAVGDQRRFAAYVQRHGSNS